MNLCTPSAGPWRPALGRIQSRARSSRRWPPSAKAAPPVPLALREFKRLNHLDNANSGKGFVHGVVSFPGLLVRAGTIHVLIDRIDYPVVRPANARKCAFCRTTTLVSLSDVCPPRTTLREVRRVTAHSTMSKVPAVTLG